MLKFVWMSDLHFCRDAKVLGHDPKIRLRAAIDFINSHHSDAEFCIISGDMVNRGTEKDYQALDEELEKLSLPFYPMVGNHDNRALLKAHLPTPTSCMENFVQYAVQTDKAVIVALDTHKTSSDAGEFCNERYEWLASTLKANPQKPVLLFMHHHPMPLGLPMQDTENMQNGEEFLEFVSQHKNVKQLCIGHVHRAITGSVRGIPFATMKSVLYQAPASQPAWNWDTFAPAKEAPNIGLVTVCGANVTLQYQQFCPYELGT